MCTYDCSVINYLAVQIFTHQVDNFTEAIMQFLIKGIHNNIILIVIYSNSINYNYLLTVQS